MHRVEPINTSHAAVLRGLGAAAASAALLLASCGGLDAGAASIRADAQHRLKNSVACVYAIRGRTVVVTTNTTSARTYQRRMQVKGLGNSVTVQAGSIGDSLAFRNRIQRDVTRTMPPIDERVSVEVDGTYPTTETASPKCGKVVVTLSGLAPLPTSYETWISGLRERLPTRVAVRDLTYDR